MEVKSEYDEKSGILTITCDRKDVILAFGNEKNYRDFMGRLVDELEKNL